MSANSAAAGVTNVASAAATAPRARKITFLLQKKDSKATERWQGSESAGKEKWELRHV
ncbi:hypothetical protein N4Q70_03725 [Salmonella enterica subsp. enterica serovar Weltevreden]